MTSKSYEGKAKRVTLRGEREVEVYFKDDATAFNAQKRGQFAGKGALNSVISEKLFDYLKRHGVQHHYIRRLDERTLLCDAAKMFALEAVVRFRVAGSLQKRTGLPTNTPVEPPVVEFYYKRDDLGDPMVNNDHIRMLQLATPDEVATMTQHSVHIANLLYKLFARVDVELWDIKFEFGRTHAGLVLADEISPDTCRLREAGTGRILDKDLFRLDAGDLLTGYREVLSRMERALAQESSQ